MNFKFLERKFNSTVKVFNVNQTLINYRELNYILTYSLQLYLDFDEFRIKFNLPINNYSKTVSQFLCNIKITYNKRKRN